MVEEPDHAPRAVVEIVHRSDQPSKVELEEDARVDATFEEAVDALVQTAEVHYIRRPLNAACE